MRAQARRWSSRLRAECGGFHRRVPVREPARQPLRDGARAVEMGLAAQESAARGESVPILMDPWVARARDKTA